MNKYTKINSRWKDFRYVINEKFDWRGGKAFITKYSNDLSRINDHLREAVTKEDVDKIKKLLDSIILKTNELKQKI